MSDIGIGAAANGAQSGGDQALPTERALVTGGAGFIGSNLADSLLAHDCEVVVFDDFSTGRRRFLDQAEQNDALTVIEGDVLDLDAVRSAAEGCDTVFHLQANADVRHGLERPRRDIEQNAVGTSNVLEAMRAQGVERIVFASSGSVYGEPEVFPTPENCAFPTQTSLYGASKLAAEGLISSYCHAYGLTGTALRFVSVLGRRYTHGHLFDFYAALRRDPSRLRILGNGQQRKSYMHVDDCVRGVLTAAAVSPGGALSVFNLGTDETVVVNDSVAIILSHMGLDPELEYAGGARGWPGDSPLIHLDCGKIRAAGWEPELTIAQGIVRTLEWFDENLWVFEESSTADSVDELPAK